MSITVPPGVCRELEIISLPSVRTGHIYYHVPINGSIAIWLDKAVALNDSGGEHFNWDLPASTFIALAEVMSTSAAFSCEYLFRGQDRL